MSAWEFDGGEDGNERWIPFSDDVTLKLEQAHASGLSTLRLKIGFPNKPGVHFYVIDFDSMTQLNEATEKIRPIRRINK